MTMILEMSDCDKKFLQMQKLTMLKCEDRCTNKDYATFNHKGLQQHVSQLKSPGMQDLMTQTFADLFEDAEPEESVQLVQVEGSEYMEPVLNKTTMLQVASSPKKTPKTAAPKKTKFNNPPVPRTKVPGNPCTDPNRGAPSTA